MFGVKINEFDNTLGTIEDFNKIFPNTKLSGKGDVEILDIADDQNDVYVRNIEVNGKIITHDFGSSNFLYNEDFLINDKIRFKYFAKDVGGNIIAKAYNFKALAEQLDVSTSFTKARFANPIDLEGVESRAFNITRKEL